MQFYQRFGLTLTTYGEDEWYVWRLHGEPFISASYRCPQQFDDYIRDQNVFGIIAPVIRQLNDLGFTDLCHIVCDTSVIYIRIDSVLNLSSYSCPHSAHISIKEPDNVDYNAPEQSYNMNTPNPNFNNKYVLMRLGDADVSLKINVYPKRICGSTYSLDEFKTRYKDYVAKIKSLKKCLAVISKLLPQPIAEEVTEEFMFC